MLLVQSCIVADPPEYRSPVRTHPELDVYGAHPLTQALLVVRPMDVGIGVTVPVRSEDAGEEVWARFYLDYRVERSEIVLNSQTLGASTYSDTSRSARFAWTPLWDPGCHLLTLIVAHQNSFDPKDSNHLLLKSNEATADAAIVNWWVNMVDAAATPEALHSLTNCPVSAPPPMPQ